MLTPKSEFQHSQEPWVFEVGDDEYPPAISVVNPDRADDVVQIICEFGSTAYAKRIPSDVEIITALDYYKWHSNPIKMRQLPGPVWYEIPGGTFEVGGIEPVSSDPDDLTMPHDGLYIYLKNGEGKYTEGIHVEDDVALYSCPRPVKNSDILGFYGDSNANAERVTRCINLCAGMTDDELKRLKSLKDFMDETHAVLARVDNHNEPIHERLEELTKRAFYVLTGETA